MTPRNDADWAAIERVLAGDASAEDEARVRAWALADPANDAMLRKLEAAWRTAALSGPHYDSRAAWAQVRARMKSDAPRMPDDPARTQGDVPAAVSVERNAQRRPRVRRVALQWAAALALLVGGAVVVRNGLPWATEPAPLAVPQVSTVAGQRATVTLGDGSVVLLGPLSTLSSAPGSAGERRVALTGSAYFDVVRDESRPFVVAVGATETRVLGTTFSVRGYDDRTLEVIVETGRVSVHADAGEQGVVLDPGQMGRLEADGSVTVRSNVDVALLLGWREGRLAFVGTPLDDVAAEIERWYGIDVTIADSAIAEYPLTATFDDAELTDVLTVVSRSLGVRHSFDGTTAVFRP